MKAVVVLSKVTCILIVVCFITAQVKAEVISDSSDEDSPPKWPCPSAVPMSRSSVNKQVTKKEV